MTIRVHIQVVGAVLLLLGISHALFPRYFGWKRELAPLSLLTRQIFLVDAFFIGLLLVLLGICSLLYADALLTPGPLARPMLIGMVVFWCSRLLTQVLVYDPAIWRGRPFYTVMHGVFTAMWTYVVVTYSAALRVVWNG